MTLTSIACRLDHEWQRHARHDNPRERWASLIPALDLEPDELRFRAGHPDRSIAGPVLAGIVSLARDGDHLAASLATLVIVDGMKPVERRHPKNASNGVYDDLPGYVWEAVICVADPTIRTLRETIERNAWRRWRRHHRPRTISGETTLPLIGDHLTDNPWPAATAALTLEHELARLVDEGRINCRDRHVVVELATGRSTPSELDRSDTTRSTEAAKKHRQRLMRTLGSIDPLYDLLAA